MSTGRIEKALSGFYYVNVGGVLRTCRARGKFRRAGTSPLVGDWVEVLAMDWPMTCPAGALLWTYFI